MKHIITILIGVFLVSGCIDKQEQSDVPSNITITDAYAFATMPGQSTGAAFMIIENAAEANDILLSADAAIAGITELHENLIDPDDSTMMMRKVKNIAVPAQKKIALEPTGKHVMFLKIKEPLTLGSSLPLELEFQNAGSMNINVNIIQPGTKPENHSGH